MAATRLKESDDPNISALARNPNKLPQVKANEGPYAGNLRTSFNPYEATGSNDADVLAVQRRTNENADALAGRDRGVSFAANNAIIAAAMGRINLKNQLGTSIGKNAQMEGEAIEGIKDTARRSVDAGVKKTRQNYNSRGLLYSGMREGGESGIKSAAASGLAGDISRTKGDYANLLDQQKQAYAQVGLQQQQQQVESANLAFETATRNSVARAQAYQQLASGVGQAAGYYYGSQRDKPQETASTTAPVNPASSWSGNAYTQDSTRRYA